MSDVESDQLKKICHFCVGDAFLASEIESACEEAECDFCGKYFPAISMDALADRVERAFCDYYTLTANQPDTWQERLMADNESRYHWEREGLPVVEAIQEAAGIDETAATEILEILDWRHAPADSDYIGEESEFSPGSYYQRRYPTFIGLHMGWHEFAQSLKTKARFFSRTSEDLLRRIFVNINNLMTKDGRPLVVDAGPGTALNQLFRSRIFQSEESLLEALCRPDRYMGPPPSRVARPGRMNAQGISVFYGATLAEVAIAEVRPPVGGRAVVGEFEITRQLRLLDLTAARDAHETGSIFDSTYKERLHRADFFRSLGKLMARPVMPDDEGLDYLPTQAVADFLATTNEPRLDGIIYPSAQVEEGCNVVLFHESSRVARQVNIEKEEISATTGFNSEDGWEVSYSVSKLVTPDIENRNGEFAPNAYLQEEQAATGDDNRLPSLRLIPNSMEVHHITSVRVKTESHLVRIHIT
jgi:RES domain-containing protein